MRQIVIATLLLANLCLPARMSHACSAVFFDQGGRPLLGHNMDWVTDRLAWMTNQRNVQKRGFVFANAPEFTWVSKYGSVTLNMEGRDITGRGVNEVGLGLIELGLNDTRQSTDSTLPRLSVGQWAQYQLDRSATVDEVIASDKVVRISTEEAWQSQFLVWDRSGDLALIEWLNGEMVVFRDATFTVPVVVNSTYQSCLESGDDPTRRFGPMAERLAEYDPSIDIDSVAFVRSVLGKGADKLALPYRTMWRMVFDLTAMRVYFTSVGNDQLRYFDFNSFDYSCQTTGLVLDLDAGNEGDVRSSFVPFTKEMNAELVRYTFGIYQSYNVPTSDELIEKIIEFPESAPCTEAAAGTGGVASVTTTTPAQGGSGSRETTTTPAQGGTRSRETTTTPAQGGTMLDSSAAAPSRETTSCSYRLGRSRRGDTLSTAWLFAAVTVWRLVRRRRRAALAPNLQ
jgi:choloylglycine hydrolase